jgi:hypothetical protein
VTNLLAEGTSNDFGLWFPSGTASVTGTGTVNLPAVNDRIRSESIGAVSVGETLSFSVTLSGTGTTSLMFFGTNNGTDTQQVTLTSTPTRYVYNFTTTAADSDYQCYISRQTGDTATTVTASEAQLENITANASTTVPSEYVSNMPDDYVSNLGPELFDSGANTFESGTYSWSGYGSNTVENDNGELKITYVDTANGGYLYFRDSTDFSTDLVVGRSYLFTGEVRVGSGDSVLVRVASPASNYQETITSTTAVPVSLSFVATATTTAYISARLMDAGEEVWFDNMSLREIKPPANILGVQYFSTKNSCSVASGVVTECGSGSEIPTATLKGLQFYDTETNVVLQSRQFDTTWTSPGVTPVLSQNQVGIDGFPNTAWLLEDDDAGAKEFVHQPSSVSDDSSTHVASVYIRKDEDQTRFPELLLNLTGGSDPQYQGCQLNTQTGATAFRLDNTSNDSCAVVSFNDLWWKLYVTATNNSTGNTNIGIQLYPARGNTIGGDDSSALGTAIFDQVDMNLAESYPGPPIYTTTASVTRNKPRLSYPSNGILSDDPTSLFVDITVPVLVSAWSYFFDPSITGGVMGYTSANLIRIADSGGSISSIHQTPITAGVTHKTGFLWGSTMVCYMDGVVSTDPESYGGSMNLETEFYIGCLNGSSACTKGNVKNVKIYPRELSNAQFERHTQ